jgi:anthranilate synthase/aminodeoxychorismate synthase-like glutamine amidotransferase
MKILLVDNYDSFTFNLYQYLMNLKVKIEVVRNDEIILSKISPTQYSHIVISPGPGHPDSAGLIIELIKSLSGKIPILGVCLGHQAIGRAFGGQVVLAPRQMHGKTSQILHDNKGVFKKLPKAFTATRYHSLVVSKDELPSCLEISAKTSDGVIMGLRHKKFKVEGVQFHPESYATEKGIQLLKNFLNFKEKKK